MTPDSQAEAPSGGARFGVRVLLTLAWPILLARSAQSVIGFADALMTAPLGEESLAAVTAGGLNFFALVIFPMGLAFIVQSFAAQLKGRGDLLAARRYAHYGLWLAGGIGGLGLLAIPLVPWFLSLFPYADGVRAPMTGYMQIRIVSLGAVVATEVLGNWFGGLGNTHLQMRAGIIAMVANVALNWLLIFGHLGLPALGVNGAALASTLATCAGFLYLAWAFSRGVETGRVRGPLGLRAREFVRMLRFGVPHGFNWLLEFTAFWLFINVIVADLGTTTLAAMMVVMQINSISFMPAFGLSSAGAILTGQTIGEGNKDAVRGILRRTLGIAALWQGTVGLFYLAFPVALMSLFAAPSSDATSLATIGATMLALSAGWQLFDALVITQGEILRAAGDTTFSLWMRFALAWALFLPSSYYFVRARGGGYVAAMLCIIAYLGVLGGVLFLRFRSGAWRKIDLVGHQVPIE